MTTTVARPVWYMTDAELLREADALAREADRDALTDPVTLARHLTPTFRIRPHARAIGAAMASLRAGEDIVDGVGDRLMILTPPQIGKSTTVGVWGALWWMALHPDHRILNASYGNLLATTRGRQVRRLVSEFGPRYALTLERGSQSVNDWKLTTGGGMKSVGVGAGVAGAPGDIALLDDLHRSRADADSIGKRDTVHDWMSADIISRLAPNAPVCLVMTRWHEDDVAGRLLRDEGRVEDGGRWRVLHLPAFAGQHDPLGRAPGEPLSHPKLPAGAVERLRSHWEDKRRSTTVRDWHALYMGDPRPSEGALVSAQLLTDRHDYKPAATPQQHVVAIDPSGGGRDTCGIVAGWRGDDNRVYLTHNLSAVMPAATWARTACELAIDTDADRIVYESNYGGDMIALVISTAWTALAAERNITRPKPYLVQVHARKGKLLRAEPIAQLIKEDRVRLASYMPELESEWTTWQPTDSDSPGALDASVYVVYALIGADPAEVGSVGDSALTLPTAPGLVQPGSSGGGGYGGGMTLPTIPGMPGDGGGTHQYGF